MFAKRDFVVCFAALASLNAVALGAPMPLFGNCDANGECSAEFTRPLQETRPVCGTNIVSIAWRKNSSVILLQCVGSDTAEENKNFLVDGDSVIGLNYGRYVKVGFLQQSQDVVVPDRFGSTPLCSPADRKKLSASMFVLLDKRPGESGMAYCYDITYLSSVAGVFHLDTNASPIIANDRDHFMARVPSRTKRQIKRLVEIFSGWKVWQLVQP